MRVALLAQAAAREHSSGVVESIEAELTRDAATLLAVAADPVRLTLLNRLAASGTRFFVPQAGHTATRELMTRT